jgi:hypothetical protein
MGGGGGSGQQWSTSYIKVLTREVKLTYLQSVQVALGTQDAGTLSGEGGGVGTLSSSSSEAGSAGFLGIGASGGSASSRTANDTGWIMSRHWRETHFDRNRYAIGIRDIGAFNYTFTPTSALVSKAFTAPKPIYKCQIRVVEQIPVAYAIDKRYIEYFVSPDNGETWHQINPLDHPTIVGPDGQVVPRTITFNAEVGGEAAELEKYVETNGEVRSLRYMVMMRNDPEVSNPERHTPVLKQVRLLMYTRGGL